MAVSPSFPPTIIRASAGTGKTFQLTNRYISLLAAGEQPDKILATTFTRKAAGEIHTRVVQRLASAAQSHKDARELGEFIANPSFTVSDAARVLKDVIRLQHRLRICTLDSFCVQIARCFSLELGLLPGWHILDEATWKRIRRESVRDLCTIPDSSEFVELMRLLNKGDVRRSVQQRIEDQVSSIYDVFQNSEPMAWQWLEAPEGTSTADLSRALSALQDFEPPKTAKGKPNSHWEKALRKSKELIEAQEWFEFAKLGLVARIVEAATGDAEVRFARHPVESELVEIFAPFLQQMRAELIGEIVHQTRALHVLLSLYDQSYGALKEREGGLEFNDVKRLITESFLMGKMVEVYYRLDSSISHILLDEFQDTSRDEWLIVEPVVDEILSNANGESSFFCVGDVKQAIYGWRGGVAYIFESLENRWPHLAPDPMDVSYRSSSVIMEFVNSIFHDLENNEALSGVRDAALNWQGGFSQHSTARSELAGYASLRCYPLDEDDEYCLGEAAAEAVQAALEQTPSASIGVLVRTNKEVARVGLALSRLGIRASGEGGNYITDSCAVNAILALFYLVDHPGDSISAYLLYCSSLSALLEFSDYGDVKEIRRLRDETVARLQRYGYGRTVAEYAQYLGGRVDDSERRRLSQLVELAFLFDKSKGFRVEEFVRFVEQQKIDDATADRVRVMTVHQSKGLEFDVVILPDLDGSLDRSSLEKLLLWKENPLDPPTKISSFASKEIRALDETLEAMHVQSVTARVEEELCLLYVAITRARQCLHILIAPEAKKSGIPLTGAGVLRGALAEQEEPGDGKLLFEVGDADWWKNYAGDPDTDAEQEVVMEVPEFTGGERRRGLPRISPSQLEGGQQVQAIDIFSSSSTSFSRGSVFHALFELVEWSGSEIADRDVTAVFDTYGVFDDSKRDRYYAEFLSMLDQPELAMLLNPDRYSGADEVRVEREYPFAVYQEGGLLNGYIDRLVLNYVGGKVTQAEVIDFKSDQLAGGAGNEVAEDALSGRESYYLPQVEAYSAAVRTLFQLGEDQVKKTLAFISHDIVREL